MKDGDNNTKYFHHYANQRRKSNLIACVEDARGTLYQTQEDISGVFMDHYRNIYNTSTPIGIEDLVHNFNTRIPGNGLLLRVFYIRWVRSVMRCLNSVSYSILVNGIPSQKFFPSRGLRQGDPISPYIFILHAKVLSSSLLNARHNGIIHGIPAGRDGFWLNHLFFYDDSLIFCKTSIKEWWCLHTIFHNYEMALGQILNRDKTLLFFNKNTKRETQHFFSTAIGVLVVRSMRNIWVFLSWLGEIQLDLFSILWTGHGKASLIGSWSGCPKQVRRCLSRQLYRPFPHILC